MKKLTRPRVSAPTGYASEAYARALAPLGEPLALPRCEGWLLARPIVGAPHLDARGCYPFFACTDWSRLASDLDELAGKLVSVVLVSDPFGEFERRDLEACFPDRVAPFKEHFVVELARWGAEAGDAHHRRNARKALAAVEVEADCDPGQLAAEWPSLYQELIARHDIRGSAAFSPQSLILQLSVPGLVALRARCGGDTVGATLWYVRDEVAYYHLGAYSAEGYRRRASYALFWRAIECFADRGLRWLSLGAGAGTVDTASGLTRFKRGWSNGTRTVYLCGRICDRQRYAALAAAAPATHQDWFPAYRAPGP